MKIVLELGDDVTAVMEGCADGSTRRLVITPRFAKKTGQVTVAHGTCETDGGDLIEKFALTVSGATGKLTKGGRTAAVTAAIDEQQKK